jgi:hypothetical protein
MSAKALQTLSLYACVWSSSSVSDTFGSPYVDYPLLQSESSNTGINIVTMYEWL